MPRGKRSDRPEPEQWEDGDVMPGVADGEAQEPTPLRRRRAAKQDEGQQESFAPPPPGAAQPGYINPPALEDFSNATYLTCEESVQGIVAHVLTMEEFAPLRGIPYAALWRRKGKPTIDGDKANRQYVGVRLLDPMVQFLAREAEVLDFPHYTVNFYWLHFEELRKADDGAMFVPQKELERHVFFALRHVIASESGVLQMRSQAGIEIWTDVVARYGLVTEPLVRFARQARMFADTLD